MRTSEATLVLEPAAGLPSKTARPHPHPIAAASSVIRVGNYLSATLSPFYQGVTDYLAERLERPAFLATASSLESFSTGEVDVGFL